MYCQATDWCKLTLLCDESISTYGNWMCKPYEYNFFKNHEVTYVNFFRRITCYYENYNFFCV